MFSKEKAAQYLIVAWVKDWTVHQYLETIHEEPLTKKMFELTSQKDFSSLVAEFPWMPVDKCWYIRLGKKRGFLTMRRMMADVHPAINERLWNAKNNQERLALAAEVLKARSTKKKITSIWTTQDKNEDKTNTANFENALFLRQQRHENNLRNGSSWNTIK